MKNQTTTNVHARTNKPTTPPALIRALRAAIEADKLGQVLLWAGAKKLRGTPTEILEEVAAAQTADWIVGAYGSPMSGVVPVVPQARIFEAAAETIDSDALEGALEIVGIYGSGELETIRTYLASNLALTALEAARFAEAEGRPVCHNCVAIGGLAVARSAWRPEVGGRGPATLPSGIGVVPSAVGRAEAAPGLPFARRSRIRR